MGGSGVGVHLSRPLRISGGAVGSNGKKGAGFRLLFACLKEGIESLSTMSLCSLSFGSCGCGALVVVVVEVAVMLLIDMASNGGGGSLELG